MAWLQGRIRNNLQTVILKYFLYNYAKPAVTQTTLLLITGRPSRVTVVLVPCTLTRWWWWRETTWQAANLNVNDHIFQLLAFLRLLWQQVGWEVSVLLWLPEDPKPLPLWKGGRQKLRLELGYEVVMLVLHWPFLSPVSRSYCFQSSLTHIFGLFVII